MRILLVNHHAGSPTFGMSLRPYYLASKWISSHNEVTIASSSYSHLRSTQPSVTKSVQSQNIDGIHYRWYKTAPYQDNSFSRFFNIFQFLLKLFLDIHYYISTCRPDIVISSSTYPLDIWPSFLISRLTGARLVFELHDIWPLSLSQIGGMSTLHPFYILCRLSESFIYLVCDGVVSLLPGAFSYVSTKGVTRKTFCVVPNGYAVNHRSEATLNSQSKKIHRKISELKDDSHLIVVYAGQHSHANSLDNLLKASNLVKNLPISFILIGTGSQKSSLQSYASSHQLFNVHFFDPVPRSVIPGILSLADIAYMGSPSRSIYKYGVSPNKLFDYMGASLPVIYAVSAYNNPVEEANSGFTISPDSPSELAGALINALSLTRDQLSRMGKRGRNHVLLNYNYNKLSQDYIVFLQSLLGQHLL